MYHLFHPCLRSLRTRMQTATAETESKSRDLSICVHHYTLRAPCPKGQGTVSTTTSMVANPKSVRVQIAVDSWRNGQ